MNKKYSIVIALIICIASFSKVTAQEQLSLREKAKKHYNQFQYFQAATAYQKLVETKKPLLNDMELLADCYWRLKNYEAAEVWYSRVVAFPKSGVQNLLKYGEVLKANEKYTEAKSILQQYASITKDQAGVTNIIAGCDSALVWMKKPTAHQIKNEAGINNNLSQFSAFPYQQKMMFTGEPDTAKFKEVYARTGNSYLRIFTADKSTSNELNNVVLDASAYNDGVYHIGPVASNKAGSVLYVTRTTTNKKLEVSKIDHVKYLTNNLELYIYKNENGKWEPKPFAYNNVEKYALGQAALSVDEQVLYFTSNMPGGFGGTDIWFSTLQADGTWSKPENAGASINTAKDEMFPYVAADGVFYFSSTGWPGMGGMDIFKANGSKKDWSKATNLKHPLNSSADDFAYVLTSNTIDGSTGYLSSNRKGGKGGDDIYSFTYQAPKIILTLKGTVTNKKTGEIIPAASITLFSAGHTIVARNSSSNDGSFTFSVDRDKDYVVLATKDKFETDSVAITTKGLNTTQTLTAALSLNFKFEVGKVFKLNDINYDFNKDNIRPDAAKILDGLVTIMQENPTLQIELGSHTDSRGADVYNQKLSQRRAQSVVNYLVSKGVDKTRMIAKGYGETQLLNDCGNGVNCTEAQHQENRRTEFKILKY